MKCRLIQILLVVSIWVPFFSFATQSDLNNDALEKQQQSLIQYFFAAARTGEKEVINTFLDAGFPINQINPQSYTALMVAAYHGQSEIVETLLRYGADTCIQDKRGNTAIMGALIKGEFSIATTLYDYDCDPDIRNKAGMTLKEFAEFWGQKDKLTKQKGWHAK
ncbi:ankyrin repeat domain-containing protein [Vibrio sp. S9_S30]|uniref:ankyrin repeat domain-containing protein n=1 Tax=Vibrio sp. S9_S30 TaxID=2720226 RepID=UPI00168164AA|nr:ankyrin repeat domain-containing protein [Vibrio sp. S9_S30]MBD1556122.1 ankyrin repeat domain-containing protein [Vibrio sp. S9_S30]